MTDFAQKIIEPINNRNSEVKRISVLRQQEDLIIKIIQIEGYDPLNFPKNPLGKAGVKKVIREKATREYRSIFGSNRVFNDAWQRNRKDGRIKDA